MTLFLLNELSDRSFFSHTLWVVIHKNGCLGNKGGRMLFRKSSSDQEFIKLDKMSNPGDQFLSQLFVLANSTFFFSFFFSLRISKFIKKKEILLVENFSTE